MSWSLKATTHQEFFDGFPQPVISITGEPTYEDLTALRDRVYANAASVPSTLGGGAHGHLGMVMPNDVYAVVVPETAWVDPIVPPDPVFDGTTAQIAEQNRAYQNNLKAFNECTNLQKALVQYIAASIDDLFIKPYHRPYIQLLGRTTKETLTWLINRYGKISETQIQANEETLKLPYNPNEEPFQILVDRYERARDIAHDANDPISEKKMMNSAIVLLKQSGTVSRPIELWKELPAANRTTWAQFKTHFEHQIKEYQSDRSTAASAGFHQANAATAAQLEESFAAFMTEQNTQAQALATMTTTQIELLKLLQETQSTLAALQSKVQGSNNNDQHSNRNKENNSNNTRRPWVDNGNYCWSHGHQVGSNHTSESCTNPSAGHKKSATRTDTMGGSDRNKNRITNK